MLPGRPAVPRSGCAGSFLRRATSFYLLKLRCRHEATTSYDRRVFERHTHAQAAELESSCARIMSRRRGDFEASQIATANCVSLCGFAGALALRDL